MATAHFFHKVIPTINNGLATVTIKAYEIGGGEMTILDDVVGEDSHTVDAASGATPQDQARPGTIARIVEIASRRGLSLSPGDVSEVAAP